MIVRELFRSMLKNIRFELKCPFKKGIYQRDPIEIFNLTAGLAAHNKLSIPSFVRYDKEVMIRMVFSTKNNGNSEPMLDTEETFKFVDVTN